MLLIDSHCHYGPGDGLTGPWDTRAPLDKYRVWAREAGIQKINLFAAFHFDYARANRAVGALMRLDPRRFSGFAFVNAAADRGRIYAMVREAVLRFGFKGIKVHRYDARISREVCEVAQAFRLPILYDVMGEVAQVELLATEYPKVNFIIPHLGSFADDWKAQLAFIPMLERHPNVFTDTSGVRRFDLLEMAVQRAGPHKILFGSDGPWLHPGVELEKVYALKLPRRALQMVLAGNFLRLTGQVRSRPGRMAIKAVQERQSLKVQASVEDPWMFTGEAGT